MLSIPSNGNSLQTFEISKGTAEIAVTFPMTIEVNMRNGTAAVYRGPLLYALPIDYSNKTYHQPLNFTDQKPLPDDQVHSHTHDWVLPATSQWKYAIDPSTLEAQSSEIGDVDLKNPIWASDGPPTTISVDAYPIEWNDDGGQPSDPPVKANVTGTARKVKLVPYGAAKLHIAEFPIVNSTQLR